MSGPLQRSMQGTSQFVSFQASMQKSMCGSSQKIPIDNASTINKIQRQKDLKAYKQLTKNKSIKQQDEEEQQNQFLNVGKWNKQRQSEIRKSIEQQQNKTKQAPTSIRQSKVKSEKNQLPSQPPSSKWEKKKSYESSSNRSQEIPQQNNKKNGQQIPQYNQKQSKPVLTSKQSLKIKEQEKQIIEDEHPEEEDQQIDQQQEEEQEEQQQEQEEEEQQEEQQQEEEDQQEDEDEDQEEHPQEQELEEEEEEQEQVQDKFTTGVTNEQFEQSSQAMKTQTVNTSAVGRTPMISKWGKKKTPLETMTKYEQKQQKQQTGSNVYHSRLNSASNIQKQQQDQITEDIPPENDEEWTKVEKVLLRLKLLLS